MRVGLDAMGGDHAPQVIIDALILFLKQERSDHEFILFGSEEIIRSKWPNSLLPEQVHISHASEIIEMHEKPVQALRSKKDSSLVRLIEALKKGEIDVALSAGNTGALVACSLLKLRCLSGIERPALITVLPSLQGKTVLLDSGANVDCSSDLLVQFAMMGSVYAKDILKISSPKVALLNIISGTTLGQKEILQAHQVLVKSKLNYSGLVQAHEIFKDDIDVLVTDGFIGNVALKAAESTINAFVGVLKSHISESWSRKMGALLMKPAFDKLKKQMDYSEVGGAPLLGVNGNVIKSHGGSTTKAIYNAISVSIQSVNCQINQHIVDGMNELTQS